MDFLPWSLSRWFCCSLAALLCLFSSIVYVLRRKPWCKCHVCQGFLSSSWTKDFDNLSDWYTHLLRNSPSGTIHLHILHNIITANPDNVHSMLLTNFNNYPKGKPFSVLLGDLLGRGIFVADGRSWCFQRKMASLELGSVSIRSFAFDVFASQIRSRLLPLLSTAAQGNGLLDLQDVFRRFSFDTICRFSFGVDPGCLEPSLPPSEFAAAFDLASRLSAERALSSFPVVWKLKRLLNLGSEKQLREAIKMVNAVAEEMITRRRNMGFSPGGDLLSRFMGSVTDDAYLRDIVVSFMLAGRDTVASALTSFFWLLAQNPQVVSEIRNELERVMEPGQDSVSFKKLREMNYLHACLYECMRLYPPVQFDSKFAEDDDVLPDGTFVERGTRVTYHPYAMGRMERIWGDDCLDFKPERWIRDGVFVPQSPYKYPVFQAGPRVCLGKEMAIVQMKCVALAIIKHFDILLPGSPRPPRFSPGLTATVRGGLPVLVQARDANQR